MGWEVGTTNADTEKESAAAEAAISARGENFMVGSTRRAGISDGVVTCMYWHVHVACSRSDSIPGEIEIESFFRLPMHSTYYVYVECIGRAYISAFRWVYRSSQRGQQR